MLPSTPMLRIKYQRTSSVQQKGERFSTDDASKYSEVIFDQGVSGTKPFRERTGGKKIISLVEQGLLKELVLPELRDLGRTLNDSISVLDFLEKNNVSVVIQSLGNIASLIDGKKNPLWTLISSVMSALYAMELENLKLRTEMGRTAYLMRGGRLGRTKGSNETNATFINKPKTQEVISLLRHGKSTRDICSRLRVSPNLVSKVRKLEHLWNSNKEAM
jgi:DNA invertase Pin-like site-specific DNA recombinase